MEGFRSIIKPRNAAGLPWPWLLAVVLSLFPFLMGISMDLQAVEREGLLQLYQRFLWSDVGRELSLEKDIRLFQSSEQQGDYAIEFWNDQLKQKFKINADSKDSPLVRVNILRSDNLSVRVDVDRPSAGTSISWEDSQRLVNNGIMLGPWMGMIMFVLGFPFVTCVVLSAFGMLWWYSSWNLLGIPFLAYSGLESAFGQFVHRWKSFDWSLESTQVFLIVFASIWAMVSVVARRKSFQFYNPRSYSVWTWIGLSFLVEPLFLYFGSRLGAWAIDAKWWLVYFGSFEYRFVSIGMALFVFFTFRTQKSRAAHLAYKPAYQDPMNILVCFLPLAFLLASGWSWSVTALNINDSLDSLLRLKGFLVALLISFTCGSRMFSQLFLVLLYTIVLPPSEGHAKAAAYYGSLMDGALVGWVLTPYKGLFPVVPIFRRTRTFILIAILGWGFGTFLTSVGLFTALCWPAYILAIWTYAHFEEGWTDDNVSDASDGNAAIV